MSDPKPYVSAVPVTEMFVDHSYQRPLDPPRMRRMAETWEVPLVGIVEVSDRGPAHTPRYAVIDGQHRYAAAGLRDPNAILVANVHTGLSVRDEARLFWYFDSKRTRLTGWDRWHARRGAGDPVVLAVEDVIEAAGLRVDPAPANGNIRCVATCEKVVALGGGDLLAAALNLITEVWGVRVDAFDAPIVHGAALVLWHFGFELDLQRLADALLDVAPRQLKAQTIALREFEQGTTPKLAAMVLTSIYNRSKGPKLRMPKDFRKPSAGRRLTVALVEDSGTLRAS